MGLLSVVLFLVLVAAIDVSVSKIVRYDGHKVIRVQASNADQLKWLAQLHDQSTLDFWTHPSMVRPTDIRLSPDEYKDITGKLAAQGLNFTIMHEDVQKLIESVGQHPHSIDKRQLKFSSETVIGGFPTYDNIYQWLVEKEASNPTIMSVESIGTTYEGRDQYLAKIGVSGSNKPIIWIDSGIHAREWLGVSTTLNLIDTMINGYNNGDSVITDLLNSFDWYILPVANPDGYVYTHSSGGRLWRKTRTVYSNGAVGVDPNRNWGYYWCITGSSHIPTATNYCGPSAWSEKCVANMKTKLESIKYQMKVFMTLHSYGQMWFIPYAWSKVSYPRDYSHLYSVARSAVSAMNRLSGVVYRIGRVPDLLYEASGSSMDWVKGTLGTKYAYGMELPPANSADADQGFIVPTSHIQPVAQDVWEALKVVAQQAKSNLVVIG